MIKKTHIRKGDNVMVISGENKGQQGRVLNVDMKKSRVLVEGVSIISKHTKPNAESPQGGIVKKEAPVHISNLMLIDPKSGKPTRVGRKIGESGRNVRYSKKSGEEIK